MMASLRPFALLPVLLVPALAAGFRLLSQPEGCERKSEAPSVHASIAPSARRGPLLPVMLDARRPIRVRASWAPATAVDPRSQPLRHAIDLLRKAAGLLNKE